MRLSHRRDRAFGDTELSHQGRCFQIDFSVEHRNVGTIASGQVESIVSMFHTKVHLKTSPLVREFCNALSRL